MVSGPGLTDDVRTILYKTAQKMLRKEWSKQKIKGEGFEGLITTKNETSVMGSIAGILFKATVETEATKTRVHYLIRRCEIDFDDGEWIVMDVPESKNESHKWN